MLKIFEDKLKLAEAFCEVLLQLNRRKERLFLVLSGGNMPKTIFQVLVNNYNSKINWSKVHIFWGDERCVQPDDDESNYGMTKKYLLDFIEIPGENVHRIEGENNPESEIVRYSEEIKKFVPLKNDLPVFDLMMLGIGEDGHIASIFPDQMRLLDSHKMCAAAFHPASGQKRITLTGRVINNSERIIFLITGKKKADVIKKILIQKNKILPAEFIKPAEGSLSYFIDSEAAALLDKKGITT